MSDLDILEEVSENNSPVKSSNRLTQCKTHPFTLTEHEEKTT